jgi:hypothetical protein
MRYSLQFGVSRGDEAGQSQQLANGVDRTHVTLRKGILRRIIQKLKSGSEVVRARLDWCLEMRGNNGREAPFTHALDPLESLCARALVYECSYYWGHKDFAGNFVKGRYVWRAQKACHESGTLPF